jgi:excisionase family DNA binding protein
MSTPTTIEPLSLSPTASGRFLGVSKRTIYNLISARKITAKKDGARTLVDVASIRAYYAALPDKDGPEPLFGDPESKAKARPKAKRKTRH